MPAATMTSQQSLPRLVRLRPARRSAPALPPPDPLLSSHRPPPLAAEWKGSWLATPFLRKRSRSHLTVSQSSPCRAGTMAFAVSPFPTSTPSSPAGKSGRTHAALRRHLPCNVVRISDGLVCPRPSLHMLIMIQALIAPLRSQLSCRSFLFAAANKTKLTLSQRK